MTGIAIYVEGGGDGAGGKAQLRQGFDALFAPQKDAARARKLRWRLVMCGARNTAFEAFERATAAPGSELVVLLVDAEGPVSSSAPRRAASRI